MYCWTHSTYQLREVSFFSSWHVCVYIIKSSKLSQWCEVSVLALRKGKVHTQLFNWKQLRHYTTAKILRLIYLPMPVHVLILGIAYTLNFSLSVYFATQASTLLPSAEFDAPAGLGIMTSWFHCKNMINMSGRSTLHTCVGSLFLRSFLSHHSFPSRQQNVAESFSSSTPPCPQLRLLANWRTGMIKSWSTLTKRRWATSEVLYWSQRGNGKLCV